MSAIRSSSSTQICQEIANLRLTYLHRIISYLGVIWLKVPQTDESLVIDWLMFKRQQLHVTVDFWNNLTDKSDAFLCGKIKSVSALNIDRQFRTQFDRQRRDYLGIKNCFACTSHANVNEFGRKFIFANVSSSEGRCNNGRLFGHVPRRGQFQILYVPENGMKIFWSSLRLRQYIRQKNFPIL